MDGGFFSMVDYNSEELLEIFSALPDPLFILSEDGYYEAILGGNDTEFYHDGSSLVGKSLFDVLPESKAVWFVDMILQTLEKNAVKSVEYSLSADDVDGLDKDLGPNGELRFEGKMKPLPFLINSKKAVVWIARNITESFHLKEELHALNNNLEKEIEIATQDAKNTQRVLIQRQKLAEMGEMINAIAHQWRQPLATSNMAISILKDKSNHDSLDKDFLNKTLNEMESLNMHMSDTVESFLNYFSPNKEQGEFDILHVVDKAISFFSKTIKNKSIVVKTEVPENISVYGYKEEYLQVVLSIVSNAIQAFSTQENKLIKIIAHKSNENVSLDIIDNAGGVSDAIVDKIFNPYFTTKESSEGTGLGLFIANKIVSESMNGKIIVANTENGAKFSIVTNVSSMK
jgi:signal transduction histidine kinase